MELLFGEIFAGIWFGFARDTGNSATNLPAIAANELRIDNIFLLAEGSMVILDYESMYKGENKLKYMEYVVRVGKRYQQEVLRGTKIWMVVIYTADIEPEDTKSCLDFGSMAITIKEAYLSSIDSESVKEELTEKVQQGIELDEEDLMKFIVLPLTYKGEAAKNHAIRETFNLVKQVGDKETPTFILSGILVFTDKIINERMSKEIKEWLKMTQVGRLFEEEKLEAVKKATEKGIEKGVEQGIYGMVSTLKDLGVSDDIILNKLKEKFQLGKEKAEKYLK